MPSPFRSSATQAVQGGRLKEDASLGRLAASLIAARQAKNDGDRITHAGHLVKFDYALKKERLDAQKKRLDQAEKHHSEIQKLMSQLSTAEDAKAITDQYLAFIEAGELDKAVNLLAIMKDANPDIARLLEARSDPLLQAGEFRVADDVQEQIFSRENREYADGLTPDQVIRDKDMFGRDLSPFQRARQAQQAGADVDPSAAARIDVGQQASADAIVKAEASQQPQRTTDTAAYEAILQKYPAGGAMNQAFNAISKIYSPSQANRVASGLDRIAGGVAWENQPDEKKIQIADDMKQLVDIEAPGGESIRKVVQAREELQREIPYILDLMEAWQKKNPDDNLGRWLQIQETGMVRLQGRPTDPDIDAIFTATQDMIANVLLIRSGATVTDAERQIMNAMVPTIGVPLNYSLARGGELLKAGRRAAENFYGKILGQEITTPIISKYYTPEIEKIDAALDLPEGVKESKVQEMMKHSGKSRKEVLDFLRQKQATPTPTPDPQEGNAPAPEYPQLTQETLPSATADIYQYLAEQAFAANGDPTTAEDARLSVERLMKQHGISRKAAMLLASENAEKARVKLWRERQGTD